MLRALFESIHNSLEKNDSCPLSRDDAIRKSCAALLVEISRSDYEIQAEELEKISNILKNRFQLSAMDCETLLQDSQEQVENSVSLHEFTRILHEYLNREERITIIQDLWHIAYADGILDKHEEYTIRKIADLLYVSQKDYIKTKLRVSSTN